MSKRTKSFEKGAITDEQINAANAKLFYAPLLIPFYWSIQKEFNLSDTETKVYGFIRFYNLTDGKWISIDRFKLASTLNCSADDISIAIKNLKNRALLQSE